MNATVPADYSRQILLEEVGVEGQALLARSRVLVIGAGGLGSPVLQYLAGAGIGTLGIVDPDTLDASNLHRQPLYSHADIGRPKVELARTALLALNPDISIEIHPLRLSAANALPLIRSFDLVVDCTDNFRAKFLINDAAVLAQRPAVFASVYQFEGQLQVYAPRADHACLRCVWPDATQDGIVGNCAQAGILGPVPGTFGAMQSLLVLKLLLSIPGQLAGEMLLLDFMNFSSTRIQTPRRAACIAPGCTLISSLASEESDLEIAPASLAAADRLSFEIIDIRSAEEVAAHPAPLRHIAMPELLENPGLLSLTREYVLVCASGQRSLRTARELRKKGLQVRSLTGGLPSLQE